MASTLILNAQLVNEHTIQALDVLIEDGKITQIASGLSHKSADQVIDAQGKYLLPGVIDDQVHFREPGLTHKAEMYTEAKAAVAGGVTSFMEMPNTVPNTLTQELLEAKYQRAAQVSLANYSFFMGVSLDNAEEVLKTDPERVCGIKIFMGSSTGNMLVDDAKVLEHIFRNAPTLIATHCEDEATILEQKKLYTEKWGDQLTASQHPEIRNVEACLKSSSYAIELARKNQTRLHILHISTEDETHLFDNTLPLAQKKITSEACVHHLWFTADDYARLGNQIKCNPAIKAPHHHEGIWKALLDDRLDVIATDHAPHTWEEKSQTYTKAPAGVPLIQYSLPMMLEHYHQQRISLEKIVEKMCHNPAIAFRMPQRGYIREGYWADLVLVDMASPTPVRADSIYYKAQWSPFEGTSFQSRITHTWVSGHLVFQEGSFDESVKGKRLEFKAL